MATKCGGIGQPEQSRAFRVGGRRPEKRQGHNSGEPGCLRPPKPWQQKEELHAHGVVMY